MKTMLRKLTPLLLGAALATPIAWAQTVYIDDDFETGYSAPDNLDYFWKNKKGTHPENWAVQETDPDGETANTSLWTKGGNFVRADNSDYGSLAAAPSDEAPLLWQFDFYDPMTDPEAAAASAAYAELRKVHALSWQATIFAFGVWEGSSREKYSIRMYSGPGWVTLDVPRTEGWHTVSFVIRAGNVQVYVDQDPFDSGSTPNYENVYSASYLSAEEPATTVLAFDEVHMGGASSTSQEAFLWDNVYLANEPSLVPAVLITEQPSPVSTWRQYGEDITYTVVATGSEPFTYQWTLDSVPLVDDARISGSQTDTLSITGTKETDGGKYRVEVTDAQSRTTTSSPAELLALVEHEILINAYALPEESRVGAWEPQGGSGWFGAYYASMTDPENAERSVTFDLEITKTGSYQVQTWFQPSYPGGNRTNEAPYIINHAGGEDTVFISQQVAGASQFWHDLGTFTFDEGTDGFIKISNHLLGPGGADGVGLVFADAIRLIPVDAPPVDGDAPAISISRAGNGDIELSITGEPETAYTIESVGNLGDEWTVLGTENTDPSGNATFTDATAENEARRFYRVTTP